MFILIHSGLWCVRGDKGIIAGAVCSAERVRTCRWGPWGCAGRGARARPPAGVVFSGVKQGGARPGGCGVLLASRDRRETSALELCT